MVELAVLCGEGLTPVCESGLHHEAVGGGKGWLRTACFVCN